MTEPESYRATNPAPAPTRRDVYHETRVDETSAPVADAAAREVYQERVSGPAGDQVVCVYRTESGRLIVPLPRSVAVSPGETVTGARTACHVDDIVARGDIVKHAGSGLGECV